MRINNNQIDKATLETLNIPKKSLDIDICSRIQETNKLSPFELINNFRTNHAFDPKRNGDKGLQDFGNYQYGLLMSSYGVPEAIALYGAGLYQTLQDASNSKNSLFSGLVIGTMVYAPVLFFGVHLLLPNFGDNSEDQTKVENGYLDSDTINRLCHEDKSFNDRRQEWKDRLEKEDNDYDDRLDEPDSDSNEISIQLT